VYFVFFAKMSLLEKIFEIESHLSFGANFELRSNQANLSRLGSEMTAISSDTC